MSGVKIVESVYEQIVRLRTNGFNGPYIVEVPPWMEKTFETPYLAGEKRRVLDRVLEIAGVVRVRVGVVAQIVVRCNLHV